MVVELVKIIYANRENIKEIAKEAFVLMAKTEKGKELFDWGVEYKEKKENGKIVRTIKDLPDGKTHDYVLNKIKKQMNVSDSRGVIFDENSSISRNIVQSEEFKRFIHGSSDILRKYRTYPDGSVEFKSGNLYHAMHRADIINIHLDKHWNLFCEVADTVDYNAGDPNWLVRIARQYQEDGRLTPYYFLAKIKIPYDVWHRF